MKETILEKRW